MHVPKFHAISDISIMHQHLRAHPFGMWSTLAEGDIVVNHIPFVLRANKGALGSLVGHVARVNPVWQTFSREKNSVVVFQGEHGYISPSWYPSKQIDGKAVPTWNYTVVHAHGVPVALQDPQIIHQHLKELTNIHEAKQALPWSVTDAPAAYIKKLAKAIVVIEIPIEKLTGQCKLGQNKSEPDRAGMVQGLLASDSSQALAKATQRDITGSEK